MMAIKTSSQLGRAGLTVLIVLAVLLSACTATGTPYEQTEAASASPGQAADLDRYWDTVRAVPGEPHMYSIAVRFTNTSDAASRIPDCWAIPGPGRAGAMSWDRRPMVEAGATTWASGTATFARRIPEIDEVVCDPEVAASYRP